MLNRNSISNCSFTGLSCFLIVVLLALPASAAEKMLVILPAEIALQGPQASHALLVQWKSGEEFVQQPAANDVVLTSSNPAVAQVQGARVIAKGNGEAVITAASGEQSAQASVKVSGFEQPAAVSFRRDVLPILAKSGCNSGACHGALAGKGNFKLSLRGYDPLTDHFTITRQARGRRIELADPGRSLILAKPTAAIAHKGGIRFEVDSPQYRTIADWISQGAAPPAEDDPQLAKLEVLPSLSLLKPGEQQQLLVRAHYSDGLVQDVTPLVQFTSANEAVLQVDQNGRVKVVGQGEGAITAWFSQKIVVARVSVPYGNELPSDLFANEPRRNFIDDLVLKQLQRLNLPPSPPASDAAFLRRAYLDTIGALPTEKEVRDFLADTDAAKRDKLIEQLLARPEFVDYWTYKWSDVLTIDGTRLRPAAVKAYYLWIRSRVEKNTPWDEFVTEILTAQGKSTENGATNFYALHQDPESMTENACQAFLSLSIGCAKCHNHPLEKWTNDQYYGMANLFARVKAKGWGGDPRNGDGVRTLYADTKGDLIQPLTGKPQPPTPLDGTPLPIDSPEDRRVALAKWMTSPENPYFARAITNRVWANFFGVGLVESVDDLRVSNPASNEELLSAAAGYLVEHDFDLKALMRTILQSHAYQRGSEPLPENAAEKRFYSRYYPRRMTAEVLHDAVCQTTGVPSKFDSILFPGADRNKTDFYPAGTKAIQLYDSAVESYFLKTFGRNTRRITCECERSDEPSMVQVLHISNGDTINEKLSAEKGRISEQLAANLPPPQLIEQAYLTCLGRFPTKEETEQLAKVIEAAPPEEKRLVIEDLWWSILSSREFLFHH